jgi:hypothetical protein
MTRPDPIFHAPDEEPRLGDRGLRALLRVLVAAAEDQWGPDWRTAIADEVRRP